MIIAIIIIAVIAFICFALYCCLIAGKNADIEMEQMWQEHCKHSEGKIQEAGNQ